MADHTAGYAAFSLVPEDHRILTIEFKINFLDPAFGHALICRSRILREGGQILVGESEVFDQRPDGEALAAKAIVTLRSIHQTKIKPAHIGRNDYQKREESSSRPQETTALPVGPISQPGSQR
jgi:hypothetical protein